VVPLEEVLTMVWWRALASCTFVPQGRLGPFRELYICREFASDDRV